MVHFLLRSWNNSANAKLCVSVKLRIKIISEHCDNKWHENTKKLGVLLREHSRRLWRNVEAHPLNLATNIE